MASLQRTILRHIKRTHAVGSKERTRLEWREPVGRCDACDVVRRDDRLVPHVDGERVCDEPMACVIRAASR